MNTAVIEPLLPRVETAGVPAIQFSLLRLKAWPDLPQLPAEDMVDMARICALLSWRTTAGVIIARMLDMPKERVQAILQLLHAQGCLSLLTQAGGANEASADTTATVHEDAAPTGSSFIAKIWQRLATRN